MERETQILDMAKKQIENLTGDYKSRGLLVDNPIYWWQLKARSDYNNTCNTIMKNAYENIAFLNKNNPL